MFAFATCHRTPARIFATAVLCATLGACASVQVPKLPAGELPGHWRNAAPALGAKPDLTGWWRQFHDPQLDTLVAQALADNLDVQQAALKLRAARALEHASASAFKPQLDFRTSNQSNAANTANYFQAGFDATWELGLFGRAAAHAHVAHANTGAAAAALQSARVSLVAEVVREYLRLRAAQRSEALAQHMAQAAQRKLELLYVQQRLQLATALQVARSAADAAKANAQLAEPRAAMVQHAQALAVLLGRSEPDPAWLRPQALPTLAAVDVTTLPADLLRTRPEIQRAEVGVLKAAGELGIAKADLYPRLALGSSLTFAAPVMGRARLGDGNHSLALGPLVDIPLFDWGQRHAVRDARADQLQAALLAYRQAVLAGAAEVETDLAALQASDQRVAGASAVAAAARGELDASKRLRALAQTDDLQVADANLALGQAELARVAARLAHGLAYIALYKALGGAPLPQDVASCGGLAPAAGDAPQHATDGQCAQ